MRGQRRLVAGIANSRRDSRATPSGLPPSTFGRRAPLPVRTPALACLWSQSISQRLFNASQVLTKASQNNFALLAARQLGAKQLKDKRIGRPTLLTAVSEASVSRRDKPPRSTNAFGSSPMGGQPSSAIRSRAKLKMIEKADEKEAPLREASSLMSVNALSWLGTLDRRSRQLRQERQ